jgi:hypothetical protein
LINVSLDLDLLTLTLTLTSLSAQDFSGKRHLQRHSISMKHINEHILELYVLGSEDILKRRSAIERHLKECAGCSSLVEEMRGYYGEANREYKEHPHIVSTPDRALTKRDVDLTPLFTAVPIPVPQRPLNAVQRFGGYMRQHPVRSATGGVMMLGVCALLASLIIHAPFKDRSLVSFKYNAGENTLEALNGANEVLWNKPSENIRFVIDGEQEYHHHKTVLADLNGDGNNELVTTSSLWDTGQKEWIPRLSVFNSGGGLEFQREFSRTVQYKNRRYSSIFYGEAVLTLSDTLGKTKEIFVAVNNTRSPYYLARFDHRGKLLGEFWHFGFLPRISVLTMEPGSRPLLLLCGCNDTEDSTNRTFPAIALLDPDKLRGKTECSATRGFGYPASEAEVLYIRLPRTDIADALVVTEGVMYRVSGDSTKVRLYVCSSNQPGLEYVFSNTMVIQDIIPYSGFETVHAKLLSERKILSRLGPEYLENLKHGIRYWDGKEWRKEVVRVHPLDAKEVEH